MKYLIYEKTTECPVCKCKWENDFDAGKITLALDSDEDCLCCPDCGTLVVNREDVELGVAKRLQDLFEQVYEETKSLYSELEALKRGYYEDK
jgi:hypothetical protein